MITLRTVAEFQRWRQSQKDVAFVPTMGALHEGHLELVQQARAKGDTVVVSLFVNPTQFNDPNDLKNYPRSEATDLGLLEAAGVSAVFIPEADEIYNDGYQYFVSEDKISAELCGLFRPGHFRGMLTVVLKLFNIIDPTRAYFGEKDFQQLKLIEGMVAAFHLPIEIVAVPTVRAADGLAMSSRNVRLDGKNREMAPALFKILKNAASAGDAKLQLEQLGFKVEYVEEKWGRRLAAVQIGGVRLIDNVAL